MLRGSCLAADNFAAVRKHWSVLSVFGADMHPEKDAATLNKCEPQKV